MNYTLIEKVWGHEQIIINTPLYCLKFMQVSHGFQCSLHYHGEKDETFYVIGGNLELEYGDPDNLTTIMLGVGDSFRIKPGVVHRFRTPDLFCSFIEVSTYDHPDDSYRLIPSGPCQ